MVIHKRFSGTVVAVLASLALAGCAPKVGSERWCKAMDDKPKGDWSGNEAASYTKHCVLGIDPGE